MPRDRWPDRASEVSSDGGDQYGTAVLDPPGRGPDARPEDVAKAPSGPPSRPRRSRRARYALAAFGALLFGLVCGFATHDAGLQLSTTAPASGAVINSEDADDLVFRIEADLPSLMSTATLEYDGADVLPEAYIQDGELIYRPEDLTEGTHTLRFEIDQPFVTWSRMQREWTFTVDTTRPRIEIADPPTRFVRDAPASVSGRVDEAATVRVADRPVAVAADGTFSHTFPEPPAAPVLVTAMDRAGNVRGVRTAVPVAPRAPLAPTRAVHMTAISWRVDSLREPVLQMLREGRINTIELDLKDEAGVVGYNSELAFARRIGAVKPEYELAEAVQQIHDLGGRVIGRIVAFRDPIHAEYAWSNGMRDQVIQSPDGGRYQGYGGFTNFAHPEVREYNIAIAREAAEAGVDDILYDYARRPDGPIDTMRFPEMRGSASENVVQFFREADVELQDTGAFIGISVFGVAARNPRDIAQDVPALARVVDYIAPMIYPSHWGRGSYGVEHPDAQPYDIVRESLRDFQEQTEGTGARLVPWLQDFSLGVEYGPEEVRAQIEAARDLGIDEWIMWDALVTYTTDGYEPEASSAAAGTASAEPTGAASSQPGDEAIVPDTDTAEGPVQP